MSEEKSLSIPKPRILYALRLFYLFYLPSAAIGLVASVILCLPLYKDVFEIPDPTPPIGSNDVESHLIPLNATAALLLTHHILYSIQIFIGLLACNTDKIVHWIIYASFSSLNGIILFTLTMTGLVVFALPVLFSIIDVGTTCYICFFLDSWKRDSNIYDESNKSRRKSSSRRRSSKISNDDSYISVLAVEGKTLPKINEITPH